MVMLARTTMLLEVQEKAFLSSEDSVSVILYGKRTENIYSILRKTINED
jgi:hypothetical protein